MDAIYFRSPKKSKPFFSAKRIFLIISALLVLAGMAYGFFFGHKIFSASKKMNFGAGAGQERSFVRTIKSLAGPDMSGLKSSSPDRINILLLGVAGKGKPGQFLTDTIMIASINRKTDRIALISIPRDFYASLPESGIQRKINTFYQIGLINSDGDASRSINPLLKAVKEMTSLEMDYWAVLNFDGFQKMIDDIGGINIMNERDIYDARYPGPNYSYETFELQKGFHHLDGATALKYARERHNDPKGDFGRAKRQQQIMQAAKNKIFSASTLLNPLALSSLLDTLGDNITTNITSDEIGIFLDLAKKLDTQNITNVVLDAWNKDSLLKVSHAQTGDVRTFILVPRVGNYSEIQELAENIFDLDEIKRKRAEIEKENATIAIINKSGNPKIMLRIKKLLQENLNYKNVIILNDTDKKISEKTAVYDSTDGTKPFTSNELVTKLPADISYSKYHLINAGNIRPDITVIIGKDLIKLYDMEEGTMEELNKARDNEDF
ncbi:MAG TPA: hypothetical protein DIT25_02765 [Candidatus Moranbacteria bacterium]|nr:hypothetical protein [Candidatus Moranbacteria bacterium]